MWVAFSIKVWRCIISEGCSHLNWYQWRILAVYLCAMESRWSGFSFDYWNTPTTINFILSLLLLAVNKIIAVAFSLDQFLEQSQQSRNAVWQPSHHFFHPEGFGEERPTDLLHFNAWITIFIFPVFFALNKTYFWIFTTFGVNLQCPSN